MTINGKKYIVKVPTGKTTNDFQFDELLPAFLLSLVVCVAVSLATPAPGADIEAEFEAAK